VAVAWAVSPSAFVAVTRAVNLPAAYVCCTEEPSALAPSPRSPWYSASSPLAVKVTCKGAAPLCGLTWTLTAGGAACATGANVIAATKIAARRTVGRIVN
jgi:hypothetical protein